MPSCYYTTFHYITNVVFVERVHRFCLEYTLHVDIAQHFTYIMRALACTLESISVQKYVIWEREAGPTINTSPTSCRLDIQSRARHFYARQRPPLSTPLITLSCLRFLILIPPPLPHHHHHHHNPPRPSQVLPPSPLRAGLHSCCQNLTPLPEDTALAR